MLYKYITQDNLENRQNYMYSEYGGMEFLQAYRESRDRFFIEYTDNKPDIRSGYDEVPSDVEEKLRQIIPDNRELADKFLKSFEVRKRIYDAYDWATWKPLPQAGYKNMDLYLLLAEGISFMYLKYKSLKYLNSLLKLNDTMLSKSNTLNDIQKARLRSLLDGEIKAVVELAQEKGLKGDGIL